MAGEFDKQMQNALAEYQPKEGADTESYKFEKIQAEANIKLGAAYSRELDKIDKEEERLQMEPENEKSADAAKRIAALAKIAGKRDELEKARARALEALKKNMDAALDRRNKAAENFVVKFLQQAAELKKDDKTADALLTKSGLSSGFSNYDGEDVNIQPPRLGGVCTKWGSGDMYTATASLVQAVYLEQGEEEAQKLINRLKTYKDREGDVDYTGLMEATAPGQEAGKPAIPGSVLDSVDKDIWSAQKGPELTGRVWGYLYSANKTFEGNRGLIEKYENYLKGESKKNNVNVKDLMSPSLWAARNCPEVLIKLKPDLLIDRMLNIPQLDQAGFKGKKEILRNILEGVVKTESDPSKWKEMMEAAVKKELNNPNADLTNPQTILTLANADPTKTYKEPVDALIGAKGDKDIPDTSKAYIAGLLKGAELKDGDKSDKYKKYLQKSLGVNGKTWGEIQQAKADFLDKSKQIKDDDPEKQKKISELEIERNNKIMAAVKKLKNVEDGIKSMEPRKPKNTEESKPADGDKPDASPAAGSDKGKTSPSMGGSADLPVASADSPKPAPKPKKNVRLKNTVRTPHVEVASTDEKADKVEPRVETYISARFDVDTSKPETLPAWLRTARPSGKVEVGSNYFEVQKGDKTYALRIERKADNTETRDYYKPKARTAEIPANPYDSDTLGSRT